MNPYDSGYPSGLPGTYPSDGTGDYPGSTLGGEPVVSTPVSPALTPHIPVADATIIPPTPTVEPTRVTDVTPTLREIPTPSHPSRGQANGQQSHAHAAEATPASGYQQRSLVYDTPAPVFSHQQGSLVEEPVFKHQQGSLEGTSKNKNKLIAAAVSAFVVIAVILAIVVFSPKYYTVTVVNASGDPQLENVSIMKDASFVTSGAKIRQDTNITITWVVSGEYKGVLWLNGRETEHESGYVHKVIGELIIEIRVVPAEPEPRPGVTHWSDDRVALNSTFYQRYYVNDIFQRPTLNPYDLEITEPADFGAIAFLAAQPSGAVPSIQSFASYTLNVMNDLDMSEYLWSPIVDFRGNINGNGHTVSGLEIDPIENETLKFDSYTSSGELLLNRNREAAFIASVRGDVVISNLTLSGEIVTSSQPTLTNQTVLGMVTHQYSNYAGEEGGLPRELQGQPIGANMLISPYVEGALKPEQVSVGGYVESVIGNVTIRQAYTAAGFVSKILSDSTKLRFVNCKNYINITSDTTSDVADVSDAYGFLASQSASRMHMYGLPTRSSGQNGLTSAGIANSADHGVYFDKCINHGNITVQSPSFGAAGIAAAATSITNSANYGSITARNGYIGGLIIGSHTRDFSVRYSYNWGALNLHGDEEGGAIGGIAVGHTLQSTNGSYIYVRDSANYGQLMSSARTKTVVGGIIAEFNTQVPSAENAGRLYIQNCMNYGPIDVVEDVEAKNYFAGIVARVTGNGRAFIDVVFVSGVVGAASTRGAAVIDYFPENLYENITIRGALWHGNAKLTRVSGFPTSFRNFLNCGRVLDSTGEILWEEKPISSAVLTLEKSQVTHMFTSPQGVMELLRANPDPSTPNVDYEWSAWVADSLPWFKHSGLGEWGMYLGFSNIQIAKFDFAGGWLAAENSSEVYNNLFVHEIDNPENASEWVFKGYSTSLEGEVVFPKSEGEITKITVFGDLILYEKWVRAA